MLKSILIPIPIIIILIIGGLVAFNITLGRPNIVNVQEVYSNLYIANGHDGADLITHCFNVTEYPLWGNSINGFMWVFSCNDSEFINSISDDNFFFIFMIANMVGIGLIVLLLIFYTFYTCICMRRTYIKKKSSDAFGNNDYNI